MQNFIRECNDQNLPDAQFMQICKLCRNTQCERSSVNNSKWIMRISTQEERLFNPIRITESSKYEGIKHFTPVEPTSWDYSGLRVPVKPMQIVGSNAVIRLGQTQASDKEDSGNT